MAMGAKVWEQLERGGLVGIEVGHPGGTSGTEPCALHVEKEGRRIFGLSSWTDDAVSRGEEVNGSVLDHWEDFEPLNKV